MIISTMYRSPLDDIWSVFNLRFEYLPRPRSFPPHDYVAGDCGQQLQWHAIFKVELSDLLKAILLGRIKPIFDTRCDVYSGGEIKVMTVCILMNTLMKGQVRVLSWHESAHCNDIQRR